MICSASSAGKIHEWSLHDGKQDRQGQIQAPSPGLAQALTADEAGSSQDHSSSALGLTDASRLSEPRECKRTPDLCFRSALHGRTEGARAMHGIVKPTPVAIRRAESALAESKSMKMAAEQCEHMSALVSANIENEGAKVYIENRWPTWTEVRKFSPATMIPFLDSYGNEGWELVHM
jgi:hypothetical protein